MAVLAWGALSGVQAASARLHLADGAHGSSPGATKATPTPARPPAPRPRPDSDEPWRIDAAHGPTQTVSFETDEGTWLALDVHPDGQRLVFSLLGDLYMLPLSGGRARRITSGPAYDVQPRFSPDGRSLAFASDRDGLENLWTCDLDGGHLRQVSHEKEHTVSAPEWSPDGSYLVGRKRLTDRSPLGTVELWLFHLKGGEGVALTKKDEQPDAADPTFSPDGRFLYFSAREARYRYDRNVNEGIWQIKRLDRRTGQTIQMLGEFGGSAAPVVSPDGKSLAYVRRVRAQTRLELLELGSGRTRVLLPNVERDLMEGFSFHGVYPGYAWTPDGRELVLSSEGRLWRVAVADGTRQAVPFTAQVEQTLAETVRSPRRVPEGPLRARIVRWPVESPDGRLLVFSALGQLHAQELPKGTPRRLTQARDFEYAPAFAPDGRSLVYVTWNDTAGGQVWRLGLEAGATPRQLTSVPAQYVNPSFSPDGRKIVFVKSSGVTFRAGDPVDELWHELWWVPSEGGEAHYVIGTKNRSANRRMPRPTFSADGERVFYLEDEDGKPTEVPKAVLVSVQLDGTDRREHLRWPKAEEAVPSPDGRWVAYSELHDAYVVPLPEAGKGPVDVSTDGPLPIARLSEEGGEWLSWADQGRTVGWIFGPTYRRIALDKAFPEPKPDTPPASGATGKAKADKTDKADKAKSDKQDAKPALPESQAIEIVLEAPRAAPSETVAYRGARVVTMKGDEVLDNATLVVTGARISAVGPAASVSIPAGARVVDVSGRTIIPGLFDEHAHLHYSALDVLPQRPWKYLANLAYGVTTTHDPSAATHEVFGQAELVESGRMIGPRIFSTGFILFGADDPGRAPIKSLDDARHHVRRLKSLGAFSVKSYMQPRRDQRQWVLQAAREEGMLVVPEGGGDLEMDMTMVLDGHTTIEHALPVTPLRKDVVQLLARSGTAYTPTLLVAYGGLSGDRWFHQHYDMWKDEQLQRYVPQSVVDTLGRIRSVMATDPADWHHIDVARSARDVLRAGGRVCLGGHGQMQGLGPHWEMWAFVQGGMTPLEALRVATRLPAETLGLERDLGSLESGKLADFVVLAKNPLEDIHNSTSVALVVKNGQAYTPEELATQPKP
jgi:Tol biopolymer transport system component